MCPASKCCFYLESAFSGPLVTYPISKVIPYICLVADLHMPDKFAILFQFTSSTTTSLMHPIPAKLTGMGLLPIPFLQTTQRNLPSIVNFPAFLLLITFVFLTFTLNHFDSNAPFQASSLASRS